MACILVVDDLPGLRALTAALLRAAGHQVHTAGGGREALAIARSCHLDLILLDLEMPDMNGLEVLKRLKERGVRVPVVVFTGMQDAAGRERAQELGATRVVLKGEPGTVDDLLGSVSCCAR